MANDSGLASDKTDFEQCSEALQKIPGLALWEQYITLKMNRRVLLSAKRSIRIRFACILPSIHKVPRHL